MTAPVATLGGVPLLARRDIGWRLQAGVHPHVRVFEVANEQAEALLQRRGEPVDLVIDAPGFPPLVVKGLFVLRVVPSVDPHTVGVVVTDQRYFWPRRAIVRDYNVRRRVGETRLVGEGRIENRALVNDVAYAQWSLKDEATPWRPEDLPVDVLGTVAPGSGATGMKRGIEVEDLSLAHGGDSAVDIALAYCAGFSAYVALSGRAVVFDTLDGSEARVVARARPIGVGSGYFAEIDNSFVRPSEVRVYFEREVEVRFDFAEGEATTTRDARILENVLPCPDITLDMNGRTVMQGTWLEINSFLSAIAGTQASDRGDFTQATIREYAMASWPLVYERWGTDAGGNDDPVWSKRLSTVRKNWRLTFRPVRQWRDKIRSIRAYRVGVVDPETGTRAPAEVFCDYLSKPSARGIFRATKNENGNQDVGYQVSGYAALLSGPAKAAPASVVILDEEAGVFHVRFNTDPWGEVELIVPGNVDSLPKIFSAEWKEMAWYAKPLRSDFKLVVILSCVQAAPNGLGRFHREVVKSTDMAHVLGRPVGQSDGEPWDVIVTGNMQTARFMWHDSYADAIEGAFLRGGDVPTDILANKDQIRASALAEAARLYATMLDRVEGSFSIPLDPSIVPTGAIDMVEHRLEASGRATTTIRIMPEVPPPDPQAYLPASVQRAIRKLVQL